MTVGEPPHRRLKVALLFVDDSSLTICRRFAAALGNEQFELDFVLFKASRFNRDRLSPRQLSSGLGGVSLTYIKIGSEILQDGFLEGYDVVASAKYPILFRNMWRFDLWSFRRYRPCFVGFFPGIELKRKEGFRIRQYADILCLNTGSDLAAYREARPPRRPHGQQILKYNPSLIRKQPAPSRPDGPVVFFTQSVCPLTLQGRLDIVRTLVEAARRHPHRRFIIKLRHLPHENKAHTHREKYSFPMLLQTAFRDVPPNLEFSETNIDRLMGEAGLAITVSSTAGLEALARDIPTLFYLDHVEAGKDPLNNSMRRFLDGSGLIAGKEDILELRIKRPDPAWLADVLSDPGDIRQVLAAIERFRSQAPAERKDNLYRRIGRFIAECISVF